MAVVAVAAGVGAAAGIYTAVTAGKQGKQAIQNQANQAAIDSQNNYELQKAMIAAQSADAKLKVYADTLSNIRAAQVSAIIQSRNMAAQAQKAANDRNLLLITLGGGVILMTSVIYLKRS